MREPIHTTTEGKGRIGAGWRTALLAIAVGGMAVAVEAPALAQPEPPRFEATVLERVEPRNGFRDDGYRVHFLADDGTVYGTVYQDNTSHLRYKAIKSRVGEGTTWLLPRDPGQVEVRTVAASTSGVALLFVPTWPENYVFVPNRGVREINSLHPDVFFAFDMNNEHVMAGQTGVNPRRAVAFRPPDQFTHLAPETSAALKVNQVGSIVGFVSSTPEDITFRVWHANGRESDFVVSRLALADVEDMNNADEVAGFHLRYDLGQVRKGGWFWSERTGLVEIPFRRQGTFRDASIFGITDDGWVLGKEDEPGGVGIEYFLWHVDAGFFDLGDLYAWEGRFTYPADGIDGAANSEGQLVVPTLPLESERPVYVFLDPVK